MTPREAALTIGDRTAIARLIGQVHNQVPPYDDSGYPTDEQIACVLHALADHTHIQHMLGNTVPVLGEGGPWPSTTDRAHIIGRYFQALANEIHNKRSEYHT